MNNKIIKTFPKFIASSMLFFGCKEGAIYYNNSLKTANTQSDPVFYCTSCTLGGFIYGAYKGAIYSIMFPVSIHLYINFDKMKNN